MTPQPDGAVDHLFLAFQQVLAGRYSLERELGRGGMGVVYLAREVRLDRPVAIKLLPPEFAAASELRERFIREAGTAARLSHPYIVPIHSVDEIDGFVFFVMAYVDGDTLAQRVAGRGPMPADDVIRVLREVAWALAYAHAQGIVHRDVKPANILLERGSARAMVADFGIARLAHTSGQTAVGELLGTPEYMSPEQASGDPVDGRSDLYSLGVVGFYALTGTLPFTGSTQSVLAQHITKPAPATASVARGAPRALTDALDRCLAKDPADRFANGEALADALAATLARRADVPVPVRLFVDRRRNALLIIPISMLFPLIPLLINGFGHGVGSILPAISIACFAVGAPSLILLGRLRRLAKLGYGPDDIVAALRGAFERRREEFLFDFGQKMGTRERIMRWIGVTGLSVGAVSGLLLLSGLAGPAALPHALAHFLGRWTPLLIPATALGLYVGTLTTAISVRWRRLRAGAGSIWSSFWQKSVGRAAAKLASYKLQNRAVPANRGTELAIAMSAEALFESLSKDVRQSLGDVPGVLHVLQTAAHAAREHMEALDVAIAEADRAPAREGVRDKHDALAADLRDARAKAETRLTEMVTALETVRLDLLRLQAGVGSAESITQDLAAAETIGRQAERLLAGRREVEDVIAKGGR